MNNFPEEWICSSEGVLNIAKTEFLVRCPYDQSHRVLNHRYAAHLIKCRTNYEVQKAAKDESPHPISCRYNVNHKVYSPELLYHEHTCLDKLKGAHDKQFVREAIHRVIEQMLHVLCDGEGRNDKKTGLYARADQNGAVGGQLVGAKARVASKMLNPEEIVQAVAEFLLKGSDKHGFQVTPSDMKLVTTEVHVIIENAGKTSSKAPTEPEEIQWPDPKIRKERGITRQTEEPVGYFSQTEDPESFDYDRRPKWCRRRDKLRCAYGEVTFPIASENDDDNWNLNTGGLTFDWLKHQRNLRGPLRIFPPGLTRSQRRAFEISNSERLKYEEGIFFEEESNLKEEKKPDNKEETK